MADGKKIEIRIAATGGAQAAEEVRKVDAAMEQLATATTKAEKSVLGDDLDARFDALKKRAEALRENTQATEEMGQASEQAADRVSEIANRQQAEAIAQLGQAFGQVGSFLRETSAALAETDPELSKTLANAAEGLETLTSAATLAAQGFAAGGPLGAAIGAMAGLLLPSLKNALDEAVISMGEAAAAEQRAADLAAQLQVAQEMGADAYFDLAEAADNYAEKSAAVLAAVNEEIAALERRNKLSESQRDLAAAERDKQDAERIRNGEAPEQVKSDRAVFDADQKKKAIDDETALAEAKMRESATKLQEAEKALEALKNDPRRQTMTKDERLQRDIEIAKADEARSAAGIKFLDDRRDFETTRDVNNNRKATIDLQTDAKVIGYRDSYERKREAEMQREIEKRQREEEAARRKADSDAKRRESSIRGIGGKAERLIPKDATDQLRDSIRAVSAGLNDGDQGGELKQLAALMKELATAVQGRDKARDLEIEQLRTQISSLRKGGK
jgi:hypothetical protein